jgi:hypothetical protein
VAQFKYGSSEPKKVRVIGHGGREIEVEEQLAKSMGYKLATSKPQRANQAAADEKKGA